MASGMTGGQPVTHGEGGLRRHIPGGEAGASGGDDEIHRLPLSATTAAGQPRSGPVSSGTMAVSVDRVPGVFQNFHNQRPARVRALSPDNSGR